MIREIEEEEKLSVILTSEACLSIHRKAVNEN